MWTSTFNVMSTEIQKAYRLILNFIMEQQKKVRNRKALQPEKEYSRNLALLYGDLL